MTDVYAVIEQMTEDELRAINFLIVARLRALQEMRTQQQMSRFRLGDRVRFEHACGHYTHGVLARLNRKTVTVITEKGERWKVAPGLLQPREEVSVSQATDASSVRLLPS